MRNIEPAICSNIELFPGETKEDQPPEKSHATSVGCIDPATGRIFVVNQRGHLVCSRPCGNGQFAVCTQLELPQRPRNSVTASLDFGQLLNLAWLEEESTLFAVFRTGELIGFTVTADFTSNENVVDVYVMLEGIASAAWSPDYEQLALVTHAAADEAKLLLVARGLTFNVLNESVLDTNHPGEKQFITVGWGKKETQFHGKAGKDARKEAMPAAADAVVAGVLENAAELPVISWREDCNYFAVGSVCELEGIHFGQRVIRVYDRDGVLQYTSEHVPPRVGSALAWRPSGNLIAASYAAAAVPPASKDAGAKTPADGSPPAADAPWQIIFFEKNGLRHGEFSLGQPYVPSRCSVPMLLWNADSSVLAVVAEFPAIKYNGASTKTFIMLWTVMNYHWYLKQTLPLKPGSRLTQLIFDPTNALQLHAIIDGTTLYTINFRRNVCCSNPEADALLSHVAVIDGNRILVTCFGEKAGAAVIPPPMCSYAVTLSKAISAETNELPVSVNGCRFYTISAQSYLIVTTSDQKRHVFLCPHRSANSGMDSTNDDHQQSMQDSGIQLHREQAPPNLPLMHYVASFDCSTNVRLFLNDDSEAKSDALHIIEKLSDFENQHNPFTSTQRQLQLNDEMHENLVVAGSELFDNNNIVLHLSAAEQSESKADHNVSDSNYSPATIFRRYPLFSTNTGSDRLHAEEDSVHLQNRSVDSFKLLHRASTALNFMVISHNSANNRLYADAEQIADDCTSYYVHSNFLIYTTHRDELKCVPHAALERFAARRRHHQVHHHTDAEMLLRSATFARACEKGAVIVSCSATQVVLQMPRGNLEAIYPRALVVQRIFNLLSAKPMPWYAEAYQLARRHRVNSNIVCDFDSDQFRKSIDEFIQQLVRAVPSSSQLNDYLELFITDFDVQDSAQAEYKHLFDELVGLGRQQNSVLTDVDGKDFQGTLKLLQDRLHARLAASSTSDNERRLLFKPILATYAKLAQFEEALMCCKQWRSMYAADAAVFSLDEALKFLMYWVHDMNQLFDYALSTYDFEIALLVGQKSTRDPREFVPVLRQFRPLTPPSYQHYAIDRHLRNYRKALTNLTECVFELTTGAPLANGEEADSARNAAENSTTLSLPEALKTLVQLVHEQKLFVPAISLLLCRKSLIDKNSALVETLNTIRCDYAAYLYDVFQNYNEAACQYYHAGAYERACQLYQTCANWQMALVCKCASATQSSSGDIGGGGGDASSETLGALAKKAVRQLTLARRFDEARNVAILWLNDYSLAFQTCVDGHLWREARELLYHPRLLLLDGNSIDYRKSLEAAVKQQAGVMREDVAQWSHKFHEYFDRLMLVRTRRAARALLNPSGPNAAEFGEDAGGDDAASTITSTTTSTASSRMSSVSRHKSREDRKKRSLKQGGRYEHVALMEALRTEIYTPTLAANDAVINVLDALILCDDVVGGDSEKAMEIGKTLQNEYYGLVQLVSSRASAIWRPEEQLREVYQLNACVQPQQQHQPPMGSGGNSTLVNAVLDTPGRIDKAKSEALYVDGMSAEDVALFIPPKIDLTKWNNHTLMGFKEQ